MNIGQTTVARAVRANNRNVPVAEQECKKTPIIARIKRRQQQQNVKNPIYVVVKPKADDDPSYPTNKHVYKMTESSKTADSEAEIRPLSQCSSTTTCSAHETKLMMGKEVDPSDVGKHPDIIRTAQAEMTRSDILVCGQCHGVFHFIEEFVDHKNTGCLDASALRENRETKPKVWAFLLWKASQLNANKAETNVNSWKLYQTWVKLDEAIRETWVVAGRTIQSFARMGQGNLQEMPVKITKTVVDTSNDYDKKTPAKPIIVQQPRITPVVSRTPINKIIDKKDENNASFETGKSDIETPKVPLKKAVAVRSPLTKLPANPATSLKNVSRVALKSIANSEETEQQTIEKILAKRFNPRRREHEYLIKWENFTHEQNTWEPQSHLGTCPQLLETFEKQLARQKEQRAAMAAKAAAEAEAKQKQEAQQNQSVDSDGLPLSPLGGRNSKAKAMDQVKQWCADNEEEAQKKRKSGGEPDVDAQTDDDGPSPNKALRRESPAVAQAIQKANQAGVRIVPVNKPSTDAPKVNGLGAKVPQKTEVGSHTIHVGKQTGIVKKPGVMPTVVVKNEAQIRVVQKGETTSSGVVRINAVSGISQTKIIQKQPIGTTIKSIPNTGSTIIRQTTPKPSVPNTKAAIAARAPPPSVTPIRQTTQPSQQIIRSAPQQRQQQIQQQVQRTSISPNQTGKAVISRVAKNVPTKIQPVTSQEDKLAALQRHGDLKITRKQLPTGVQVKPIRHQPEVAEIEYNHQNPFGTSGELSLCPVTGKVLGAGGEEVPDVKINTLKMEQQQEHLQQQQLQQEGAGIMSVDETGVSGEIQQMMVSEDGSPILVTGEDGTVYQVAGKNEQGQTILIAQGADGEQQCVYVTSEESEDPATLLGGDMQDASAALLSLDQHHQHEQHQEITGHEVAQQTQFIIKTDGALGESDVTQPLAIATDSDSQDGQITAEVVQADCPSPGGTRRVVLLLPDGSFMMTEVSDEQYQALNLST